MSITPIFDALKREREQKLITIATPNYGDLEAEYLTFTASGPLIENCVWDNCIIPAPETTWKTFLRCLGWWKP